MAPDPITTDKSAVVLIDHTVAFANAIRSQTVEQNVSNATALAEMARAFDLPLVVTSGRDSDPPGPLYPSLLQAIGDQPIVRRSGQFNAFLEDDFADAVEQTGRKTLVMAGLMTEGCLLITALEARRRGYEVHAVVDASGGETPEAHAAAVQRMIMAGIAPCTMLSVASELQVTWSRVETVGAFTELIIDHSPQLAMTFATHGAATAAGAAA